MILLSAELEWSAERFWSATPAELLVALRGRDERQKAERRLVAWQTSLLMACWSSDAPSMDELLGEAEPAPLFYDAEEFKEHMREKAVAREAKEKGVGHAG